MFRGAQLTTETTYQYEDGLLVRSWAVTEPEWTDLDRGLVLALLAERAEICSMCGHPMSVCRDPSTAGTWKVIQETCEPSRVAQAVSESSKARGLVLMTRR
jgi:hypothetical protein